MYNFDYIADNRKGIRYYVKHGDEIIRHKGFRSKKEADEWINSHSFDWRSGFLFCMRGEKPVEIIKRNGERVKV